MEKKVETTILKLYGYDTSRTLHLLGGKLQATCYALPVGPSSWFRLQLEFNETLVQADARMRPSQDKPHIFQAGAPFSFPLYPYITQSALI